MAVNSLFAGRRPFCLREKFSLWALPGASRAIAIRQRTLPPIMRPRRDIAGRRFIRLVARHFDGKAADGTPARCRPLLITLLLRFSLGTAIIHKNRIGWNCPQPKGNRVLKIPSVRVPPTSLLEN